MAKNVIPDWALKHKTKGTSIHCIRGKYYLYKISSKWDSKKGRAVKKTDSYLGRITEEGFISPKLKSAISDLKNVTIKEFGASVLMNNLTQELQGQLKKIYPQDWKSLFTIAAVRFFHNSPMKNMNHHFQHSYLSELFSEVNTDPRVISNFLEKLGSDREKMVLFMKELAAEGSENLIVDLTHIFSESENMNWLSIGHNSQDQFHQQINMLLIFSQDRMKPVYFRLLPGAIRDVSSLKATIAEGNISNALFVGDKGFHSFGNVEMFEEQNLRYILPLKRNNSDIDYEVMKTQDRRKFDGSFFFQDRLIWSKEGKTKAGRRTILFFDQRLRTDEEKSFLDRVHKMPKEKNEEKEELLNSFYEKQFELGTITIITNSDKTAEKIYQCLKARTNIEVAFDTFKNILEADKTYMRSDAHMYGWMLVNFLSLLMYYALYGILTSRELLAHYSPKDIIMHFSKVYKVKVGDRQTISEIPKTTRVLSEKMGFDLDLLRKTC